MNSPNKYRTNKGEGTHLARQLSAKEKARLTIWIYNNRELCASKTSHELAKLSSEALGFEVSESSVMTSKNSVHEDLRRTRTPRVTGTYYDRKKLEERVQSLEDRIDKLCRELGISKE